MVKHTQTIRRLLPTNCLSVFDHFVGLALKGLINSGQKLNVQKTLTYHVARFIVTYFNLHVHSNVRAC